MVIIANKDDGADWLLDFSTRGHEAGERLLGSDETIEGKRERNIDFLRPRERDWAAEMATWSGQPSVKGSSESMRMALLTFSLVGLQLVPLPLWKLKLADHCG